MHLDELMTVSRDIVSEKYLEDILQLVVMVAANAADIDICLLWMMEESAHPKKLLLKASHGLDMWNRGEIDRTLSGRWAGFIAARGLPVVVADFLTEARPAERAVAEKFGLRSLLGLPLKTSDGVPIGALTCFKTKPHHFSPEEIERMSTLADKAAITIIHTGVMVKTRVAQEELESLKLVGRAREVLMRRQGIGEDEAWKLIRHYSTESLNSPRRIAETILLSEAMEAYPQ